jgi:hypothetical protein
VEDLKVRLSVKEAGRAKLIEGLVEDRRYLKRDLPPPRG